MQVQVELNHIDSRTSEVYCNENAIDYKTKFTNSAQFSGKVVSGKVCLDNALYFGHWFLQVKGEQNFQELPIPLLCVSDAVLAQNSSDFGELLSFDATDDVMINAFQALSNATEKIDQADGNGDHDVDDDGASVNVSVLEEDDDNISFEYDDLVDDDECNISFEIHDNDDNNDELPPLLEYIEDDTMFYSDAGLNFNVSDL